MDRKQEMMKAEDERHTELSALVASLTPEQMQEPTLNDDAWSVKDVLWHLGAWNAKAAQIMQQIRMGTFEEAPYDTDEENARFMEAGRDLDLSTVKTEWLAARNQALKEWEAQGEITKEAEEWFYESGAEHMDDHLPELRDWARKQA